MKRLRPIRPPPPFSNPSHPHPRRHRPHLDRRPRAATAARPRSAYAFGSQWTGALSRPSADRDEAVELTDPELLAGELQNLVEMRTPAPGGWDGAECVAGAAGWGHSALLVRDRADADDDAAGSGSTRLLVSGRPHDFQTLLRLRRLPPSVRNFCIRRASDADSDEASSDEPSLMQRLASYLAGENEATINEAECRRYGDVKTMLEIPLPDGEIPALEGQVANDAVAKMHGRRRWMQDDHSHNDNHESKSTQSQSALASAYNHTFQNTLAASAGLTALISTSGTLYTFGLNHRGQCGVGSFTPNVWTPQKVVGLASLRFILDYNAHTAHHQESDGRGRRHGAADAKFKSGSDVYKDCKVQEHPIVSVSLGLQHGIALDCAGQVFCWGKGERGQLGQGRRFAYESFKHVNTNDNAAKAQDLEQEEPNENKTLEYAMQVCNFYDPYSTLSSTVEDVYAPLLSPSDSKIRLVSAGMNFSFAATESNLPYVWGKNCVPNPQYDAQSINLRGKPVLDSTYPRFVPGLPKHERIIKVACGTHHAAVLLEDGSVYAVGVATDRPVPMWNRFVEILPPNVVDVSSLISFTAGFDRTFVVYGDESGERQVVEIQLWSEEEMRLNGSVRPSWVDWLEENEEGRRKKVKEVRRGWMHTVILTEDC